MKRFVEAADRGQNTLFPECLEDWIGEDNPVRIIDVFVDELDLAELEFDGVDPEITGRPSYHPSVLLKLYIYGYLNLLQSSRRLERQRNEIVAEPMRVELDGRSTGEAILATAQSLGCDLLIKGAYTQSRLRQMIFGGATRHVLENAAIPVLLAN